MGNYGDVQEIVGFTAVDGTRAAIAGRMINFETNQHQLQPGHQQWLTEAVVPAILERPHPWIDIYGHASRKGDADKNLKLSRRRADEVKTFLGQQLAMKGRSIEGMFKTDAGLGEGDPLNSTDEQNNNGYWRAVEIIVFGSKPIQIRKPKVVAINSTRFEIRIVGGGSAQYLVVQADNCWFQIVDTKRRTTAIFHYTGVGAGIGIPIPKLPLPGGSVSKAGPPSAFTTSRHTELHQFNSTASLNQDPGATAGGASVGGTMRLYMNEVKDQSGLIRVSPHPVPIEGGSGVQLPGLGSSTKGVLALVSNVTQFTGY